MLCDVAIKSDLSRLCTSRGSYLPSHRLADVRELILAKRSAVPIIDQVLSEGSKGTGLGDLAEKLLLCLSWKNASLTQSDWAQIPLEKEQIVYAAQDAWASCSLYNFYQNLCKRGF